MAMTVIRAAQNSYPTTETGGTQDQWTEPRNISAFMDAVERQDTPFLNGLKKGKAGRDRKEYTGIHSVTPRGSQVASATASGSDTIPVPAGHGARFQQGHVLRISTASGDHEILWVTADPTASELPVKRAQGKSHALDLEAGDKILIIGVALPQLADMPMGPVTRGRNWWNVFQEFGTHLEYSNQARKTSTLEFPSGDQLDRDMLQKGKDLKYDLNMALILGQRQEGSPNPEDPIPSMFGGLQYWASESGNVFNLGGPDTLLNMDAVNEALVTLDENIGDKKGTKFLMSIRTKQVFNRIANPSRYQYGLEGRSVDLRTDKIITDVGEFEFTHDRHIPDGEIYLYKDGNGMEYAPFEGEDWVGWDVPTKGRRIWRGLSGTYTFRPGVVPAMALLKNFSTNLADYPEWGKGA